LDERFDGLVDSFLENKVGLVTDFLGKALSANLKENLLALNLNQQLSAAKTGNKTSVVEDVWVRSDLIYWLDRKHHDLHEDTFLDFMDALCYT